ncbi:MAG: dihydroneopterin aldolase [Slackia sp.]|nr:dihydroneopterin aldolase [Slackia sp.]
MDKIVIENLQVHANHGVFLEENTLGQRFVISAVLHADLRAAGASDALDDSIDYGAACHLIDEYTRSHTHRLIERLAQGIVDALFDAFPALERVQVMVKKPWAPIGLPLDYAAVEIDRSRDDR